MKWQVECGDRGYGTCGNLKNHSLPKAYDRILSWCRFFDRVHRYNLNICWKNTVLGWYVDMNKTRCWGGVNHGDKFSGALTETKHNMKAKPKAKSQNHYRVFNLTYCQTHIRSVFDADIWKIDVSTNSLCKNTISGRFFKNGKLAHKTSRINITTNKFDAKSDGWWLK